MTPMEPVCTGCEHNLYYGNCTPKKTQGVTIHLGERFCTCGKKARRFKRSDPKSKVPAWCPKRKTPHELRIYRFKNADEWMLHEHLCYSLNRELSPEARRYAVEFELHTELSAREFLERSACESDAELLGAAVHLHHVVEIDDGLQSVCFYKTANGYRHEPFFDAATALKNKLEYGEETV